MWIGGGGASFGPGLKKGVISVALYCSPWYASGWPLCQASQTARVSPTYSRSRGTGALHGIAKRRSTCAFTCVPSPRMKRPRESRCMPQAVCASCVGERANAMATAVPSSTRSVATAARVNAMNGSCAVSAAHNPSKPTASAACATAAASRGLSAGRVVSTRT